MDVGFATALGKGKIMHNKIPENQAPCDSVIPKPMYKGDLVRLIMVLNKTLEVYCTMLAYSDAEMKPQIKKQIADIHGLIFDTSRIAGLVCWEKDDEGGE